MNHKRLPPLLMPSLLSANILTLKEDLDTLKDLDIKALHIDVMDGHFVPNLSFGPHIVRSLRQQTSFWLDVHLMITLESPLIQAFIQAGAHHITLHVESGESLLPQIHQIKKRGCSVGLSLKPDTPFERLKPFLPFVDLALVMTVNPGFGGQSFMHNQLDKIQNLRQAIDNSEGAVRLQVDGGITPETIGPCFCAGADTFVAGSAIFEHNNHDIPLNVTTLRSSISAASSCY